MTQMLNCPNPQLLSQLVAGTLSDQEFQQLEHHIAECSGCADRLNALQSGDPFHREVQAACETLRETDETAENLIERVVKQRLENASVKASETESKKTPHPVNVACSCGAKLKAREDLRGKKVKCPQCSKPVVVPVAVQVTESHKETINTGELVLEQTVITQVQDASRAAAQQDDDHKSELTSFLSPAQETDELGRLGPYRILKVLGSGGMGVVFRAEDPQLKRIVALKAMLPGLAASSSFKMRFLREAQAVAQIKHDHIVTIHQVGEDRGAPYLAMELLQGESLDDRIKREGKLPMTEVLRIGREIAEGLDAAHEKHLIHRDIKPANIWLEQKKGRVKILDFGLARSANDSAHVTQSGAIVGTPAFMAPEQAHGTAVDHRCDLFSLGCVLYRLATGQYPFKGTDAISTLLSVASDTPATPIELDDSLPHELSGLIMHLLAKKPDQRPASAREVVSRIEDIEAKILAKPGALSPSRPLTLVFEDEQKATTITLATRKASRNQPRKASGRANLRKPLVLWIGGGFLALTLLTVIILLPGKDGTLRVEILDPEVEMTIKGADVTFHAADLKPVTLTSGEKKLKVTRGDLVFETESFEIKKGKETRVKVERLGDNLVVQGDGRVLAEVALSAKRLTGTSNADRSTTIPAETTGEVVSPFAAASLFQQWIKEVQSLPSEEQVAAVVKRLMQLNPGYDGKVTQEIANGVVTGLHVFTAKVTDIAPVRALTGLKSLDLSGNWTGNPDEGTIADLSPLQGMKLERLIVSHTHVRDLTPLRNMPLTVLECGDTQVVELAPLKGMALTSFNCNWTSVSDLSPLAGMPMTKLGISAKNITDFSPLRGMPLIELVCPGATVTDLSPIAGMPLETLLAYDMPLADLSPLEKCDKLRVLILLRTQVADLSPLRGRSLEILSILQTNVIDLSPVAEMSVINIECDTRPPVEMSVLRTNKTLAKINQQPVAEFWKEFDKQKATFEHWLNNARGLSAEKQIESVGKKLVESNPGFDGKLTGLFNEGTPKIENGVVTELQFVTDNVIDISPLAAFTGLKALFISGTAAGKGQVRDLAPLQGIKLTNLDCSWNRIYRLSPLKETPLKTLIFDFNRERDEELLRSIKTLENINYKPVGEFWKEVDATGKRK